jgi:hypothetical protein
MIYSGVKFLVYKTRLTSPSTPFTLLEEMLSVVPIFFPVPFMI